MAFRRDDEERDVVLRVIGLEVRRVDAAPETLGDLELKVDLPTRSTLVVVVEVDSVVFLRGEPQSRARSPTSCDRSLPSPAGSRLGRRGGSLSDP